MVLSSAIVCDHDRRIADDRRSSFHMIADDRRPYCDLRSAICDPRSYGNQPLDRTWFYLLRSSAITIAGSQTIADLIAICDHMETSLNTTANSLFIWASISTSATSLQARAFLPQEIRLRNVMYSEQFICASCGPLHSHVWSDWICFVALSVL